MTEITEILEMVNFKGCHKAIGTKTMGGEILTVQLGHKANYLATHFWNSQVQSLIAVS